MEPFRSEPLGGLPEILCCWASEPCDLVCRSIKHLANRIRGGDWGSRRVPQWRCFMNRAGDRSAVRHALTQSGHKNLVPWCEIAESFITPFSSRNAQFSSTDVPSRSYRLERTHSWTLADLWGLISPQHFDDMATTRQTGLLPSGRQSTRNTNQWLLDERIGLYR